MYLLDFTRRINFVRGRPPSKERRFAMVNEFPAGSYFSKILDHVEIYGILSSSVGYESERGDLLELIAINREQLVKCVGQECGALELLASEMAAKGHRELVDVLLPPNGEACGWIM